MAGDLQPVDPRLIDFADETPRTTCRHQPRRQSAVPFDHRYIRDIESDLLYHHSRRVFLSVMSGERHNWPTTRSCCMSAATRSDWSTTQ
jgi:hypothetical protein